ncbi:hypothetical protein QBC36DRAFT_33889 [Triangularia setosa]|uniref:Uncharacterized protein n=1 Tax=Triangularia setosa TaxID=2587417 RepID=A0AAN6WE15_9PEZI|nr:hypothetical protein QBC36DRAFT_33889 [Podospora setosa]
MITLTGYIPSSQPTPTPSPPDQSNIQKALFKTQDIYIFSFFLKKKPTRFTNPNYQHHYSIHHNNNLPFPLLYRTSYQINFFFAPFLPIPLFRVVVMIYRRCKVYFFLLLCALSSRLFPLCRFALRV